MLRVTQRAGSRLVAPLLVVAALLASCKKEHKPKGETGYWARPIARQGQRPASWSPLEQSQAPKDCGTCHPTQYQDWQTALHSKAMSPGLVGQLLYENRPGFTRGCYKCHAPMIEQHRKIKKGDEWIDNPHFDVELHNAAVTCAACHARGGKIHGPPPKDGKPRDQSKLPHGGFTIEALFQSSEFCAACHQFPNNWPKLNGKLMENTFEEWKQSRAAKEGKTCQTCHMPDRRHLFRGIHDLEMTRAAFKFEPEVALTADGKIVASAKLTNVGAGHLAPTYVTPRIEISFQQIDADAKGVGEASEPTVVQRHVILGDGDSRELFDTRLAQDESIVSSWSIERAPPAVAVRAKVHCIPDHFYEWLYRRLLKRYESGSEPHKLIQQALAEAEARHFDVFVVDIPLDAKDAEGEATP